MKLFIITHNQLTLNNPEVLLIKEFEALLSRDQTSDKIKAWNEFKFIYHIADPLSKPNQDGYNEKNALAFARRECGYDETYMPDKMVIAALNRYAGLRSSIIAEVCQELLISFRYSADVLKKIRSKMDMLLAEVDMTTEQIAEVIRLQKEISSMANGIPENINRVTNAQRELESTEGELLRGKKKKSSSMDPNEAIG